ncbi:MAG: hypothetical protein QWI73_06780 [Alphaproteobacteria bacterium]|nr:hypothetical protein [Alphaproteobacteria bacterium]
MLEWGDRSWPKEFDDEEEEDEEEVGDGCEGWSWSCSSAAPMPARWPPLH